MEPYILILLILIGGFAVILSLLVCIFWFSGFFLPFFYSGAPFVPTSKKIALEMVRLAHPTAIDHVVDLGSGDGRLLIEAVLAGAASGEGYEIHPGLVWLSRLRTRLSKTKSAITIHRRSYWKADLSRATIVLLYQLPNSMKQLEDKLKRELPNGARVISNAFPFPYWKPVLHENKLFVYKNFR